MFDKLPSKEGSRGGKGVMGIADLRLPKTEQDKTHGFEVRVPSIFDSNNQYASDAVQSET